MKRIQMGTFKGQIETFRGYANCYGRNLSAFIGTPEEPKNDTALLHAFCDTINAMPQGVYVLLNTMEDRNTDATLAPRIKQVAQTIKARCAREKVVLYRMIHPKDPVAPVGDTLYEADRRALIQAHAGCCDIYSDDLYVTREEYTDAEYLDWTERRLSVQAKEVPFGQYLPLICHHSNTDAKHSLSENLLRGMVELCDKYAGGFGWWIGHEDRTREQVDTPGVRFLMNAGSVTR